MSKNFELMRRSATHDFFNALEESAPLAPKVPTPVQPKAPTLVPPVAPALVPPKKAPADPEITMLVQRLFLQAGKDRGPKVVSFSGFAADERSSWICARAGEALAERAGASVCLVDANLGSPQLHVHLNADPGNGFADALGGKEPIRSFAIPVGGENLWLIPSGAARPGYYASVDRYRERIAELRETFDYVLISAPALSRETEATLLGQLADGIVLIVEADHTRRETVRRAKEQLEAARVRLLGAVLDQRSFPIPEKIYRKL